MLCCAAEGRFHHQRLGRASFPRALRGMGITHPQEPAWLGRAKFMLQNSLPHGIRAVDMNLISFIVLLVFNFIVYN